MEVLIDTGILLANHLSAWRGAAVSEFKDLPIRGKSASRYQLKVRFDAELFLAPAMEKPSAWLEPLKPGVGELDDIPDVSEKQCCSVPECVVTFGFADFF